MKNSPYAWTRRKALLRSAAVIAGASLTGAALSACARKKNSARLIKTITFPGTYNLLIWAAQAKGMLEAEGLSAEREQTTTSMYLVQNLVAGEFDIAASSIDNVVAYNEGQGEIALDRPADMIAVAGIMSNAVLPLIVQDDIHSFEDIKGRRLAVDAVSTGFSFVLQKILEIGGLEQSDYELVSVGSARDRLAALKAGDYAGAILTPPFDLMAIAAGLRQLADSRIAFDDYQATCFVTTRRWARENRDALIRFLRAMSKSLSWIADPKNKEEAGALLMANTPSMNAVAARAAVAAMVKTVSFDFNMAGIETVLALRSQYGAPKKKLTDPQNYIDMSYLEAARATF